MPSTVSWKSGPVLALLSNGGCPDSCYREVFSNPPDTVVYSDGRQIIYQKERLYERELSRTDVCALLADIDRSGFFEYDAKSYREAYKQFKPGLHSYYFLGVYAWKSNSMMLPDFDAFIKGASQAMQIPVALSATYHRLLDVNAETLKPYQPTQLAVFIQQQTAQDMQWNGNPSELPQWSLSSPSLADLAARFASEAGNKSDGELILSGKQADAVFLALDQQAWSGLRIFHEGDVFYGIAIRALFPYESSGGNVSGMATIPSSTANSNSVEMSCPK